MASRAYQTMRASGEFEMNITSMIDITFLLLIFFMVAAKFRSTEGKISAFLPKDRGLGTSSPKVPEELRVKLLWVEFTSNRETADNHGRCLLKIDKKVFPEKVYAGDICPTCKDRHPAPDFASLADFLARAKASYKGPEKSQPVILDARTKVPFKYVVMALDACVKAGIEDVTFAAAEKPYTE